MLNTLPPNGNLADDIVAFVTVSTAMTGAIMWLLSMMMDRKMSNMSKMMDDKIDKIMENVAHTYLRTDLAKLTFQQIEKHFDSLRDDRNRDRASDRLV